MPAVLRGAVRHVLGWSLLILGVAGLILPVLQGWLFIALGALFLSPDVPVFARLLTWIESRIPALRPAIRSARRRVAGGHNPSDSPPREP
ncbi:MAG: hypothetical protein ABR961_07715 [Thermoanaerobaculaceae bacterium]|jgi:uncharacterized membrane protein YbaN (DUF454 family)